MNILSYFSKTKSHHSPQLGLVPGGVRVFGISCPVEMLTHQQYPVDPEHCFGRKFPLESHWGQYAPSRFLQCCLSYSQRPGVQGSVELTGTARLTVRMVQSVKNTLSTFMVMVMMKKQLGLLKTYKYVSFCFLTIRTSKIFWSQKCWESIFIVSFQSDTVHLHKTLFYGLSEVLTVK